MVRGLTLAVALALGTVTIPAHALGLGDIKAHSALNQEFKADIGLLSVEPGELDSIRIKLADQAEFDKAGVQRPFFLSLLKFRAERLENGEAVIRVYSDFPVREPFLDFLVELDWPRGHLIREYTVLLDPPAVTKQRAPQVRTAPARTETSPAAAVPAETSARLTSEGDYGPVAANETLWSIAKKLRPEGISMEQMMIALLRANPQAFIEGDINRLRQGQVLRVPPADEINEISRSEARAAYRAAQEQWLARKAQRMQAAEAAQQAQQADTAEARDAAELRIATARPQGEGEAGASEDRGDETIDELKQKLLLARENAESSRVESESLRGEIDDMQKRLDDMQRLLSLKDDQLARLQAGAPAEGAEPASEAVSPELSAAEQAIQEAEQTAAMPSDENGTESEVGTESAAGAANEMAVEPEAGEMTPPVEEELTLGGDLVVEQQDAGEQADMQTQPAPAMEMPAEPVAEEPGMTTPEQAAPQESTEVEATPAAGPAEPEPMLTEQELFDVTLGKNLPYVAGGVVLLLLLLFLLARRRRGDERPQTSAATAAGGLAASPAESAGEEDLLEPDTGVDAETDEASSLPSDFPDSEIRELHEESGEVDPVAEADVYIAYGRYQQAQDLLRDALKRDPDRLVFKHKLAEVFYATRKKDEFNALAQGLVDVGQDVADPEGWARVCDMGRDLDEGNALYARTAEPDAGADDADAEAGAGIGDDELVDLATDLVDDTLGETVTDENRPSDSVDEPVLDLDDLRELEDLEEELESESVSLDELESLDLDMPSLQTEAAEEQEEPTDRELDSLELPSDDQASEQLAEAERSESEDLEAQLEELSDLSSLDGDLGSLTEDLEDETHAGSQGESQLDQPLSLDEAFEKDIDSDEEALDVESLAADAEGGDAVATKLDLAKAFVEMGDSDGARDILEEVAKEGNDEQRKEAESLLGELA